MLDTSILLLGMRGWRIMIGQCRYVTGNSQLPQLSTVPLVATGHFECVPC